MADGRGGGGSSLITRRIVNDVYTSFTSVPSIKTAEAGDDEGKRCRTATNIIVMIVSVAANASVSEYGSEWNLSQRMTESLKCWSGGGSDATPR